MNTPTAASGNPEILPTAHGDARLPHRDLLTIEQAAAFLHLSQSTVRSYIRQGQLKAFRVAGLRKVLIARSDLDDLLKPLQVAEPA